MFLYVACLILILSLIIVGRVLFKTIANPVSIINMVFGSWLIMGRLGFFGQLMPSPESSAFIGMNILLMDLFIVVGYFVKMPKRGNEKRRIAFNSELLFKYFRVICFAVSLIVLSNMMIGIISGKFSITMIREISYSTRYGDDAYTQIYLNSLIYTFYQYIVRGFAFFDLTYRFGKLLHKGEKIPLLTILNFILFILIMQSRIEVLKIVLFAIIYFLFSNIKLNRKQKKLLTRSLLILLVAIIATFSIRSITNNDGVIANSVDSFIIDYSGSNYTFSLFYDDYNSGLMLEDSPLLIKYLGGLGLVIERVLAPFGFVFNHYPINDYLIAGHNIGSSDHYNAFYTMYFDFMNSGGYFGCILFSVVFGLIIGYAFKKKNKMPSLKSIYIASFLTYVAAFGTYNYALSGIYAFTIVCCIVLSGDDSLDIPKKQELTEG